jgi:hypothetical protein
MISIEGVVQVILYLLGAGIVFGLLLYLINYVGGQFPGAGPFVKIARIILVVLAVLVLIGVVMALMGHPLVRFH